MFLYSNPTHRYPGHVEILVLLRVWCWVYWLILTNLKYFAGDYFEHTSCRLLPFVPTHSIQQFNLHRSHCILVLHWNIAELCSSDKYSDMGLKLFLLRQTNDKLTLQHWMNVLKGRGWPMTSILWRHKQNAGQWRQ